MARFVILFIFFSTLCRDNQALSQAVDTLKQDVEIFPNSYGEKKWGLLISLDARRSFFAGEKIKINGLKLGLTYKGVHRFGVGFYWLDKNLILNNISFNENDEALDPQVRFKLGYSSLFYERVFLKTRWWEISTPLHLGAGRIIAEYKDTVGTFQPHFEKPFSALIPSVQHKFYPWTWMSLKLSSGIRLTFNTDKEIKQTFNTAFYGFGLGVNPIELYKTIFKTKKPKEKTPDAPSHEIR